jgi:small subunit ribosomal protein S1
MSDKFAVDDAEEEDFSKLFENSMKVRDDFSAGDKIEGTIVHIGAEDTFLDISGKSEALIDTNELKDKNGNLLYKKGDKITVYIVSVKRGEIKAGLKIGSGEVTPELLLTAFQNNMPIEGLVSAEVKGGYNVTISGHRCFCPYSQIDTKASDDKSKYLNKSFVFKIIEFKENGKNIILSRRVLLDEAKKDKEANLKLNLKEGDTVTGTIASKHDFGMFVSLDGIEGMIPKSEISWSRSADLSLFKEGDEVKAKIIGIDWNKNKITLSLKQLMDEPWTNIKNYSENQTLSCKVVNLIPQGAFVEIEPGIEGFIHVSKMSHTKRINKAEDVLKRGDIINTMIISIDRDSRKISMQLMTGESDPWQVSSDSMLNETHKGIIESVNNSGVNLRLENGMLGFIPKNELSASNDMQKNYTTGKELTVTVKDIQASSKKLILSETGALKKEEQSDYNSFLKNGNEASSSSLGNLLKDKFENLKKQVNDK